MSHNFYGIKDRLARLQQAASNLRTKEARDIRGELLAGHPQVAAWLQGDSPQPCPHVVLSVIGVLPGDRLDPVAADGMWNLFVEMVAMRQAERGNPMPDGWVSAVFDEDPISYIWLNNAGVIRAAWTSTDRPHGYARFEWRGQPASLGNSLASIIGATPDCQPGQCVGNPSMQPGYPVNEMAFRRKWDKCCDDYFHGVGKHDPAVYIRLESEARELERRERALASEGQSGGLLTHFTSAAYED